MEINDKPYDMLIVGAGISGLYCAARILRSYPYIKLVIVDRGQYIGGCMQLVPMKFDHSLSDQSRFVDTGAMVIDDRRDVNVFRLAQELGVDIDPATIADPSNLIHLRGHTSPFSEIKGLGSMRYHLTENEIQKYPEQLVMDALQGVSSSTDPSELESVPYLCMNTFSRVMQDVLSKESIRFFEDASGHNFWSGDVRAATAIPWSEYVRGGPGRTYQFTYGAVSLAVALYELIKDKVDLRLQSEVTGIERSANGSLYVSVQPVGRKDIQDGTITEALIRAPLYKIYASEIVLTVLPKDLSPLYRWDAQVQKAIEHLTCWVAAKIFIQFDEPWWKKMGFEHGRSVTDLPIRQTWYYSDDPAVMMIYCDGDDAAFWRCLLPPNTHPEWVDPSTVPALTEELQKQLATMYSVSAEQIPIRRILWKYWPYGGYIWRPGSVQAVQNIVFEPIEHVHIVGDSWGDTQGTIEGALQTCDKFLMAKCGIGSLFEEPISLYTTSNK
jgi:monoamine oxidase